MSPPPVIQGPAARRPGAGAGWAGPRRWPGASGPWPTGARRPGPPGAAWPLTMTTTTTTCPITSRHAGPPGAQAVRTAAAWWRRARAGGRANGLRAGFDDTDPALQAGYGPDAAGYDGYDAAADTRVSGPLDAEPGTGPFGTGGYDTGGYEPGTGPLSRAGYKAEPSRRLPSAGHAGPARPAGARPARQPTRVPVPAARIPSRTVTPRRRGTPPQRPADTRGRAGAAGPPVPPRAQPSREARRAGRATRTRPPR